MMFAWSGGEGKERLQRGLRLHLDVMGIFTILSVVMVSRIYVFVKMY